MIFRLFKGRRLLLRHATVAVANFAKLVRLALQSLAEFYLFQRRFSIDQNFNGRHDLLRFLLQ